MMLTHLYTLYNTYLPQQTKAYKSRQTIELIRQIEEILSGLTKPDYNYDRFKSDMGELIYNMKRYNA